MLKGEHVELSGVSGSSGSESVCPLHRSVSHIRQSKISPLGYISLHSVISVTQVLRISVESCTIRKAQNYIN